MGWGDVLLGFVLGFIANAIVAGLPKPKIEFEAFDNEPDPRGWKFVNVKVTNASRWRLLRFRNATAQLVTAHVEFINDLTGEPLFPPMGARWPRFQAQPITSAGELDVHAVIVPWRETLPPGESASINIAVKRKGDDECYGFNNRNYAYPDFRDPEKVVWWKEAFIRVVVHVEGKPERSDVFILRNPDQTLDRFTIVRAG